MNDFDKTVVKFQMGPPLASIDFQIMSMYFVIARSTSEFKHTALCLDLIICLVVGNKYILITIIIFILIEIISEQYNNAHSSFTVHKSNRIFYLFGVVYLQTRNNKYLYYYNVPVCVRILMLNTYSHDNNE